MKKFLFICFIFTILFIFSGCNNLDQSRKNGVVTSVGVSKDGEKNIYSFSIINPSKIFGEKQMNEENSEIVNITCDNLDTAFSDLESLVGKVDLDHISVFCFDSPYLSSHILNDLKIFGEKTRVMSIIKCFISDENKENLFKTMSENYGNNSQDFIDSIYYGSKKKNLCVMSELFFALNNKTYNVVIPSLSTDNVNKGIKSDYSVIYNSQNGFIKVDGEDNKILNNYIKSNGKDSSKLTVKIDNNKLNVKIKEKISAKTINTIQNYIDRGFDILNTHYYIKNHFYDYNTYEEFLNNNPLTVKLEG